MRRLHPDEIETETKIKTKTESTPVESILKDTEIALLLGYDTGKTNMILVSKKLADEVIEAFNHIKKNNVIICSESEENKESLTPESLTTKIRVDSSLKTLRIISAEDIIKDLDDLDNLEDLED